ncbi:MAG: extracellular solute-binding protein [Chloroflexi bacterium]|nr:extracellular solute-binding protein [Chloroflexota bacterium]
MAELLSRRDFLRVSALAAGGAALAACAPQTPAPAAAPTTPVQVEEGEEPVEELPEATAAPAAEEGVTIQYWVGWGNYPVAWEKIVLLEEYEQLLGNNTVELKAGMGADALLTAVAGGEPPDVVSHPSGQYLEFMARGVLLPVDDLVASSTMIKAENYVEGYWNNGFWEGVQYCLPANAGFAGYGMVYNTRLVEEAGLDPDNPPLTWDECLQWHEVLTEFDSAGNLLRIGLDPYDAMGGSLAYDNGFFPPISWGWDWFNAEAETFDLNNEKMAEAFDVMGEFYRIAGPDNMAGMRQVEGQGMWGGSYYSEVQVMSIDGYWACGWTAAAKPEVSEVTRVSWAPVPESRRGVKVQGYGGHYILLLKEAPNAEAGFKIAELVNTHPACDALFLEWGCLPFMQSYLDTVDPDTFPGLDFYFASMQEHTEWHSPAQCLITAYVGTQFTELREKVYRDEMTGAEAAEEFQRRCEEEWRAAGFA